MNRLVWMVVLGLSVLVVAGCGQEASAPAPSASPPPPANTVVVSVTCGGPQQVYWHGVWWIAPHEISQLRGDHFVREITGTMTDTGPGAARLESPQLVKPQDMTATQNTAQNQPPNPPCGHL